MAKRRPTNVPAADLKVVSEWLGTDEQNIILDIRQEPIGLFEAHLEELCDNYIETGVDFKRSYYIAKLIERGEQPEPIYIAASDPDLLIIKGCHRLVAFWILGMKFVPVAYAAKKF